MFQPTKYGGPKLVCVDLATNKIIKKILFPQDVAMMSDLIYAAGAKVWPLLQILSKMDLMELLL